MLKLLQIFRAGRHISTSGEAIEFTEADVDQVVRSYDPKLHEAPLVVGHPRTDDPAYGWVQGLSRGAGGALEAIPTQVDPAFAELVGQGRFKKISASFYKPDSPANPKPGSWYLRHVGFLGAQPPAVKGLRPASFREAEAGVVEFAEVDVPTFLDQLRQLLADQLGEQAVNDAFAMAADPNAPPPANPAANPPANPQAPANMAERRARASATEQRMDRLERRMAERERELRRRENTSFLEELVRAGRPLPCKPDLLLNFMELIDAAPAGAVSFGEGEKRDPGQLFREEVLGKLPKRVNFAEVSGLEGSDGQASPLELANEAAAFREEQRAKGIVISTQEAVDHVRRKRG